MSKVGNCLNLEFVSIESVNGIVPSVSLWTCKVSTAGEGKGEPTLPVTRHLPAFAFASNSIACLRRAASVVLISEQAHQQ